MSDFPILISPQRARQLVELHTPSLSSESVALNQALGRTLSRDITAPFALPPFDNSAMDGYAVRASDLGAEVSSLKLQGIIAAGDVGNELLPNHCLGIMTGAPLPSGADAVVMREETRVQNDSVHFERAPLSGDNIRNAGSDIARGEIALRAGEMIRASQWALLAALGQAQVLVARAPRIGIVITGDELVSVGSDLQGGQIYDSNAYTLRALVEECGAQVVACVHCGDSGESFRRAIQEVSSRCDGIITSGGVSMGDFDPVRDVLPTLAQVHFWKISMKPGKPVMFATLHERNAHGAPVPVWALPGNPVSVWVTFELLARPALLKMLGRSARERVKLQVRLSEAGHSPQGKTDYQRALVTPDAEGIWQARITGEQGSGRLTTLTRANALLEISAATTQWQIGDFLPALMTDWPEMEQI